MISKLDRFITTYFNNLSTEQTTLLILRLFTALVAWVFLFSALISPLLNNHSYITRIDCARIDIEAGLSASLRQTLQFNSGSFYNGSPFGASLTTSDIDMITQYTKDEVEDAPQYITVSLWKWCRGDYNVTDVGDSRYLEQNEVVTCARSSSEVLYNYVDLFNQVGLTFIEVYAYDNSETETQAYAKTVARRQRTYRFVPSGIILSTALSFATFIVTLFIYGRDKHSSSSSFILFNPKVVRTKKTSMISITLIHIASILSLVSFISMTVSVVLLTAVLSQLRSEISRQLASFGIALHLGRVWFSLIYVGFIFSLLCALLWILPEWCGNPVQSSKIRLDNDPETIRHSSPDDELPERKQGSSGNSPDSVDRFNDNNDRIAYVDGDDYDDDDESEANIRLMGRQDSEQQLRKLGEMLSKTGRQTNYSIYSKNSLHSDGLDSETNMDHYQESTYNGYVDDNPFSRIPLVLVGSSSTQNYNNSSVGHLHNSVRDEELELVDMEVNNESHTNNNHNNNNNTNNKNIININKSKIGERSTMPSMDSPATSIHEIQVERFDSSRFMHKD